MQDNESLLMPPAHAQTNTGLRAYIVFVQDSKGDLVDVEHYCNACASQLGIIADYRWPAYNFGHETVYCYNCHIELNIGIPERMYA